jgi:hypothetical protein
MSISTPDAASIKAVNLVSLGADTHQGDMNQHFVPLSFTQTAGGLNVTVPSASAYAPPGYYMVFLVNGNGVPSTASMVQIMANPPAAPAAPTGVTATGGNTSATVYWTAPSDCGSPITSYTITPSANGVAQTPTVITGNPPATSATITGLTNGTPYTFTVSATNAVGTGPVSAPSAAVTPSPSLTPAFVQAASNHVGGSSSVTVTPTNAITSGNRIVVEVGVWNSSHATTSSVTDSAGNHYVELTHFTAPDGTEQSVWTAQITAGGGTKPAIKATPTSAADVGMAVLEYSGLSTVADATVVDQQSHASGVTSGAATVRSGATPATTSAGELALGFYADSGFGDTLTADTGYTKRIGVAPTGDMELFAEDSIVGTGAVPNAGVGTGSGTDWLMSTIVLKHG